MSAQLDRVDSPAGCFLILFIFGFIVGAGVAFDAGNYGLSTACALCALLSFGFIKRIAKERRTE